jgi:hypothetical protein
MYVFYMFSEGGRFYYEGFGFGAFMFANIAAQITGYTLLAVLFIPMGYGHWKPRLWAIRLAQAALWCWVVLGLPISVAVLFVFVTSKEPSVMLVVAALALTALLYLVVPWLMLRFYRSEKVIQTIEKQAGAQGEVLDQENAPAVGSLLLGMLCVLYAALTWLSIFFNGAFPFFGRLATGFGGIQLITAGVLVLLALAWGAFTRRRWAWWGALVYFSAFTLSSILTLGRYPFGALLDQMRFAPLEMEALGNLPIQDVHLTAFAALPLGLTIVAVIATRRVFSK